MITEVEVKERLRTDSRYFIERFLFIIDKNRNKVPFLFKPAQVKYSAEKTNHDLILKARKEGFSSEIEAEFLHACLFGNNENCVTMAHTWDDTSIHLDRVKYFIETMGLKNQRVEVQLDKANQSEIYFPLTNSRYWIGTAGSVAFGRGRDITKLHLSEVAHYKDQGVLTGVMEACTPNARIVMETTANGVGEVFHGLWKVAKDKLSGSPWKAHFFAWFEDPTNSIPIPFNVAFRMSDQETRMKVQYNLTNEQVYWHRNKRAGMTDKSLMPQEHPGNDQEAFLSSGRHAFDLRKIQEKKLRCKPSLFVGELYDDGKEVSFRDDVEGRSKVWQMPRQGRKYLIAADIAEGLNGGDYSVMSVHDLANHVQVATWRGHVDPGEFGRLLVTTAIFYENAVLIPELNNHGWATVEAIKAEKYPHLLKTTQLWKDEPEKEGFPQNERTRTQIITALRNVNDDDSVYINDPIFLDEMETFIQNERTGKFEAQKNCHDDCVITLAIAVYCLRFLSVDETYGLHAKKAYRSPAFMGSLAPEPRRIGGHRRSTGY